MIGRLTRVLVAAADLIEAEGRALRRSVFMTSVAVCLALLAVNVLLLGLVFFTLAVFWALQGQWGAPTAAAACGGLALVCAVGVGVVAFRLGRPGLSPPKQRDAADEAELPEEHP